MRNIVYYIVTANSFIAMICTCSLGSVSEKIVFVSSVLTLLALLLMSAYTIACEEDIEEDGESNLKRFLKERGVYESFCRNLSSCRELSFEEYANSIYGCNPISGAFVWSETPEGADYWRRICHKWESKVEGEIFSTLKKRECERT